MTDADHDAQKSYWERKTYWPFEVLPPEKLTNQHKREIRFLGGVVIKEAIQVAIDYGRLPPETFDIIDIQCAQHPRQERAR
jgi:hypothetical protein